MAREVGVEEQLLVLKDGEHIEWAMAPLQKQLPYYCKAREVFRAVLTKLFAEGGNRWHLVFYVDDISAGALLRPDDKRKTSIFYVSFLELGPLLSYEMFWVPLAHIRTSILKQACGGLSEATATLHRRLYLGDDSLTTNGVVLPIGTNGGSELVFVDPWANLADEDALTGLWGIKGSGGTVPCGLKCCLVSKPRGRKHARLYREYKTITCSDIDAIPQLADEDVWYKVDLLEQYSGILG